MKIKVIISMAILILTIMSCQRSTNINLGGRYKLINSASFNDLTIVDTNNIVIIDGHILEYAFDSNFIIAAQRPRDSVPEFNDQTKTLNEVEVAFAKSSFCQYWIINKKKESKFFEKTSSYSNVYGPFKKEEFQKKREELGVPKELTLIKPLSK